MFATFFNKIDHSFELFTHEYSILYSKQQYCRTELLKICYVDMILLIRSGIYSIIIIISRGVQTGNLQFERVIVKFFFVLFEN